jgi:hypothetical protein
VLSFRDGQDEADRLFVLGFTCRWSLALTMHVSPPARSFFLLAAADQTPRSQLPIGQSAGSSGG